SPLTTTRRLRFLRLTQCRLIRDLSPLARTTIECLELHFVLGADLATLAGAPLRALTIRDRRLATGLHPLPTDLPLTELTIDTDDPDRPLPGTPRWPPLGQVAATGAPPPPEPAELPPPPRLRTLPLPRPQPADLHRLAGLPRTCRVELGEVEPGQLNALRAT